jgi:hypothetical protein
LSVTVPARNSYELAAATAGIPTPEIDEHPPFILIRTDLGDGTTDLTVEYNKSEPEHPTANVGQLVRLRSREDSAYPLHLLLILQRPSNHSHADEAPDPPAGQAIVPSGTAKIELNIDGPIDMTDLEPADLEVIARSVAWADQAGKDAWLEAAENFGNGAVMDAVNHGLTERGN